MAINKVVYGNDTLVDLTQDSVSANNLLEGETAHDKSGNPVTGTAKQGHEIENSAGTKLTQRDVLQFKGLSVSDDSTEERTVIEHNINTDSPTFTEASTRANIASGESISTLFGKIKKFFTDIKDLAFIAKDGTSSKKYLRGDGTWQAFSKSTVGLGNVDNTSDADKPVSTAQQTALDAKVNKSGDTMSGHLYIDRADGTTSTIGTSSLSLGNATPSGTAGNSTGQLYLYGAGTRWIKLVASANTANRTIELPNKSGTIALTSDCLKIGIEAKSTSFILTGNYEIITLTPNVTGTIKAIIPICCTPQADYNTFAICEYINQGAYQATIVCWGGRAGQGQAFTLYYAVIYV